VHYRGVTTRVEAPESFLEAAWRRPAATSAGVQDTQAGMLRAEIRSWLCLHLISVFFSQHMPIPNRLQWYGHVLRKEDTDWMKKCMEYEVEGFRPRGRPKRTWREIVQKDCQACNLNRDGSW